MLLGGWPMARALRAATAKPLPVLGQVPAFELTDARGQPFGSAQLDGKVWVANFVFTRCPTICPAFTAKMGSIFKRSSQLGDEAQLVSFTVDPEFDTPEVLAEYAKNARAGARWHFLTGTREALTKVVVDGMMMPMEKGADGDLMSIGHGSYFVLVDRHRKIRGLYRFHDDEAVEQVLADLPRVAAEP